tara:strand:+ start:32 stop:673 length:642 start_codon:yes stop_codon:yes gene_type:complete
MAFNLRSKFTSNGFIRNVKTGATPLLQTECLKYGPDPNDGTKQICLTQKIGQDKGPTVKMNVGYENWLKKGNTGTMEDFEAKAAEWWATQGENAIIQDRSTTDAVSGTKNKGYTYDGTPRKIDPKWGKHYRFKDFTSENPTWREQKDKLRGSKRYRSFSDEKKKKVMEAYKKSFLIMNPGTTLTNRPSSTTRTLSTNTAGKDGTIGDWETRKN